MSSIVVTSYIYRYAESNFNSDGRGLFNYLYVFGHKPLPHNVRQRLIAEWEEATAYKKFKSYNHNTPFNYACYINELGDRLNKTNRDKRSKFLDGFPESFNPVILPERMRADPGSYTFPANYPPHAPAALAGTAHPHAGQPDILAMASAFCDEWSRMLAAGQIKSPPKGSVYQAEEGESENEDQLDNDDACPIADDETEDESSANFSANLTRAQVKSLMICLWCGGIGHATTVDGKKCLSFELNNKPSEELLSAIKYPNGMTRPKINRKPFKPNNKKKSDSANISSPASSSTRAPYRPPSPSASSARPHKSKGKKHIRPKRNKRVARQAEEENSETENDDCNDENNDNESSTDETGHLTSLAVSFSNVEC